MSDRRFGWMLAAILLLALLLRGLFSTADPPWRSTVGVVWHDEGAWTHNARNKVLYGAWVQDQWNPVYLAPVFTGLEYLSFETFGVGLRQARLVSQTAGVIAVLLLALGIRRIAGNAAGLFAGALLATNYVYVMYDRAALMESLMSALMVASWYCVTRAERQPLWGALAGMFAALSFFTKAAAAAYVGALGLLVLLEFRRNAWTIAGLAISFGVIGAFFVLPHWSDYQFYNWQMSVTRKPSYSPYWLKTRVTWFPILHDTFSRMWGALVLGLVGGWAVLLWWRMAELGERLLLLWLAVGILELLIHDVSNERRFVFLIPALVALASLVLARGTLLGQEARSVSRAGVVLAAPALLYCGYVILGAIVRV